MRKLKNILISGILSVCMVATSLPVTLLAQEVETVQDDNGNDGQENIQENIHSGGHQDTRREIISFTELPDEVKEQAVEVGTPVESLELPDKLTALCRVSNETSAGDGTDSDKEQDSVKDDKQPDKDKEEEPEENSGKENEDESGDSDNKSGDDSENSDNGDGEKPQDSGKDNDGTEYNTDGENGDTAVGGADEGSGETSEAEVNTDIGNADGAEGEDSGKNTDITGDNKDIEKQETVTVTMRENYAMPHEAAEIKEISYEAAPAVSELESEESGSDLGESSDIENSIEETTENIEEETPQESEAEVKIGNGTEDVTKNELETKKETKIYEETVMIDDITWKSMPEYDSETEGVYIFTPVISDGVYTLAEDVKLPEISVTVAEAELMLEESELPDVSESTEPTFGVISKDTTWKAGELSDGELIIKPGVTLTINGRVALSGTVTIKGGGTILRGHRNSDISVYGSFQTNVTIGNITIDGASVSGLYPMIRMYGDTEETVGANITICDGCKIRNCISSRGGAIGNFGCSLTIRDTIISNCSAGNGGAIVNSYQAYNFITSNHSTLIMENSSIINCSADYYAGAIENSGSSAVLKNVTIENCFADQAGGAIYSSACKPVVSGGFWVDSDLTIIDGKFINNKTINDGNVSNDMGYGGGCIWVGGGTLNIYGSEFTGNTSAERGGCICQAIISEESTVVNISGGHFERNTCTNEGYEGSGAVYIPENDAELILSADAHFYGDNALGTDGIMLEDVGKVWISGKLNYLATIYAEASEGRVIAEGKDYTLSIEKDIKKIKFVDIGNSGETYYTVLDEGANQIKLSKTDPEYGYYINYNSNGAQGQVVDDTIYKAGDTITVKSADELRKEGNKFIEWNTQPDRSGYSYQPGAKIENITDDITLYAIFDELETISATFYSGGADQKKVESEVLEEGTDSVTITAPELDGMEGWTKVGWAAGKDSYKAIVKEGERLSISKNTSYYGIYEKNVTLSYNANDANVVTDLPPSETGKYLANVHEKITYKAAEFKVAGEITADKSNWEFSGWNTRPDETGDSYKEGDKIEITEDTTLYAIFEIYPYAYFYSGKAGEREVKKTNAVKKAVITPPLREKPGWEEVGWDDNRDSYKGSIEQGSAVTVLTNDTSFYGVYKKEVTLSYSILNSEVESTQVPQSNTHTRYANVNEEAITYKDFVSGDLVPGDSVPDDPDSFEFDIVPDISQDGYEFLGWNTKPDGTGTFYRATGTARNKISIKEDTVLYAILRVPPVATFYSGDAIHRESIKSTFSDGINATLTAPKLEEMDGWVPVGWSKDETGYSGNIEADSVISLTENTSYYGIYKKEVELSYDANSWAPDNPVTQSGVSYAKVHNDITYAPVRLNVAPAVTRAGYSFVGWSTYKDVTESPDVDYYRPDESIKIEDSITLYAHMVDDIAPVLGDASYNSGYKNIEDWLVRKKELVITVPITEEGSGVNKIVYTLTPETGEPVTGEALMTEAYVPRQVRQAALVRLDVIGGKVNVTSGRTNVNNGTVAAQDTAADEQPGTTGGQVITTDGQVQARITISEDYKGTVILKCLDNAGNESPDKLLTATGGGVIVEDNAPQITFINKDIRNTKAVVTVSVSDDVDTDKNSWITGGIAGVTYQIDNKPEQNITTRNFAEEIVPSCEFNVDISGSGEHTLKVTAIDNAGNESKQSTQITITAKSKKTTVIKQSSKQSNIDSPVENKNEFVPLVKADKTAPKPELPKNSEPATGDNSMRVEVYATIAMIAGLLYVLMYFITGPNGMTEEEKNETVSRILNWAKKGGKCRKFAAVAAIFCVLFYYHSIGKRVNVEWNEVVSS